MSCTTAHKFEVRGYKHHKIYTNSQITTREIITIEEWSTSSRWFGLQKIREYHRWTRDTTTNYTVNKEDAVTIAIVECKACKQQLEFTSEQIKGFYSCIFGNPDIAQMIMQDSPSPAALSKRSESGSLAKRCQRHTFDLSTISTVDMRYIEANVTQAVKMDSGDNYALVWLKAPTTKVTQDVKASVKLFRCEICGVYSTPCLSKIQLEQLALMIPGGDSLLKKITM